MVLSCAAFFCTSRANTKCKEYNLRFHRFPLSRPVLLEQWLEAMKRKDWKPTPYSYLCSLHFRKSDYKYRSNKTILPRLKKDAVPSRFDKTKRDGEPEEVNTNILEIPVYPLLKICEERAEFISIGVQCELINPPSSKISRKLKTLRELVRRKNKKIADLKQQMKLLKNGGKRDPFTQLDSYFNSTLVKLAFFRNEVMNANKKINGQRYTNVIKEFALKMYFYSPKAYEFLRQNFTLPNSSLLRKWVKCGPSEDFYDTFPDEQLVTQDAVGSLATRDQLTDETGVSKRIGTTEYVEEDETEDGMGAEAYITQIETAQAMAMLAREQASIMDSEMSTVEIEIETETKRILNFMNPEFTDCH